jgi:hypothetical protein
VGVSSRSGCLRTIQGSPKRAIFSSASVALLAFLNLARGRLSVALRSAVTIRRQASEELTGRAGREDRNTPSLRPQTLPSGLYRTSPNKTPTTRCASTGVAALPLHLKAVALPQVPCRSPGRLGAMQGRGVADHPTARYRSPDRLATAASKASWRRGRNSPECLAVAG